MNHTPRGDVPIIGQPHRVIVHTMCIIAPNVVDLRNNGLDCGDSVAYLQVTDLLKGEQYRVPLTEPQLDTLGAQINVVLAQVNPTDYPQGGTHGIN